MRMVSLYLFRIAPAPIWKEDQARLEKEDQARPEREDQARPETEDQAQYIQYIQKHIVYLF